MIKKILITGASGFLGWNLCRAASQKYSVTGVCNTNIVKIPGVKVVKGDLLNTAPLKRLFQEIMPDAVIHTAASSNPDYCQKNVSETYKINVTVSAEIASLCSDQGIPCVFTSTDLVFDGHGAPYDEASPVSPVNMYGQQKVAAELEMQARHDHLAICRMPLMYGDVWGNGSSFIQPWIAQIRAGEKIRLFTDEIRTPVSAMDAASGLLLAMEQIRGIVHLGGKESVSRFQMGKLLIEALGCGD